MCIHIRPLNLKRLWQDTEICIIHARQVITEGNYYIQTIERTNLQRVNEKVVRFTLTTVAPQSRRKSAGAGRGLTRHLTSYPSSSALLTTCLPNVPVAPTTSMLVGLTGVPGAKFTEAGVACALHVNTAALPLPKHYSVRCGQQ